MAAVTRSDFSGIKVMKERMLFVVSQISKLRWSLKTSTSMQTRLNSTLEPVREAMARIYEEEPTFFGPPVIPPMPAYVDQVCMYVVIYRTYH